MRRRRGSSQRFLEHKENVAVPRYVLSVWQALLRRGQRARDRGHTNDLHTQGRPFQHGFSFKRSLTPYDLAGTATVTSTRFCKKQRPVPEGSAREAHYACSECYQAKAKLACGDKKLTCSLGVQASQYPSSRTPTFVLTPRPRETHLVTIFSTANSLCHRGNIMVPTH